MVASAADAKSVSNADNIQTVSVSQDGGYSWSQIGYLADWTTALKLDITDVTDQTRIRYVVKDLHVIGGFIATIYYEGQQFVTTNPISDGNFAITSTYAGNLVYYPYDSTPWRIDQKSPDISSDAYWVWNGVVGNEITFEFSFEGIVDPENRAVSVSNADNIQTVSVSYDEGNTWTTIGYEQDWTDALQLNIDNVNGKTRIRYQVDDLHVIGGFIATIYYQGQEYVTTNPISDGYFSITSSYSGNLVYYPIDANPWNIDQKSPNMANDAYWIWNGVVGNSITFEFSFEEIAPTPCCAKSVSNADNIQTVRLSQDGGSTWTTIGTENDWTQALELNIVDVTDLTRIEYQVQDLHVIGGFIATIYYEGEEYVTTEPITDGNFEITSTFSGSLVYYDYSATPWRIDLRSPNISPDAKWIWNGAVGNSMTFVFSFENIALSRRALAVSNADNYQTVEVSYNNGNSFNQIGYLGDWTRSLELNVDNINDDTILRYTVRDDGSTIGGFVASIYYQGVTYTTTNPISDSVFSITNSPGGTLQYRTVNSSPWQIVDRGNSPNQAPDAYWVWNGQLGNTIVFEFSFRGLSSCSYTNNVTPSPVTPAPVTPAPVTPAPVTPSTTVKITPEDNSNPDAFASFANDPRGQNRIVKNKLWRMVSRMGDPLFNWPLSVSLAADVYGFKANEESSVSITTRGRCAKPECDIFFSFRFGTNRYLSFVTDFDGNINTGYASGLQIYPACRSRNLARGNPAKFLRSIQSTDPQTQSQALRAVLAGGDAQNWDVLRARSNDENFPVTFTFTNNPITDTFTVEFGSDMFKKGIQCVFRGSMDPDQDITMYLTPDWDDDQNEVSAVRSFIINSKKYGKAWVDKVEEEEDYDILDSWQESEQENNSNLMLFDFVGMKSDGLNVWNWQHIMIIIGFITSVFILICAVKYACFGNNNGYKKIPDAEDIIPLLDQLQAKC